MKKCFLPPIKLQLDYFSLFVFIPPRLLEKLISVIEINKVMITHYVEK